jgi:hypothetical protein
MTTPNGEKRNAVREAPMAPAMASMISNVKRARLAGLPP